MPSLAISLPFSERFRRRPKLLLPLHDVVLDAPGTKPSSIEVQAMARDAGLIGLEREPTEAQVMALVQRLRSWYGAEGYPAVGAAAAVSRDGVLRVRVRTAPAAPEPAKLLFVDKDGQPSAKTGRTRESAVAAALGLRPGYPFCVSLRRFAGLMGPDGPFTGIGQPEFVLSAKGEAQVIMPVRERNYTEIAPTIGVRGSEWYMSLSARDGNLFGRNQRVALELSKYNASSASLSFDDPRLGHEVGWGANLWVDGLQPSAELLAKMPLLRMVGGPLPLGGSDDDGLGARPGGRRMALTRAGLTLRAAARRECPWRLSVEGTAEKVAPSFATPPLAPPAPGKGSIGEPLADAPPQQGGGDAGAVAETAVAPAQPAPEPPRATPLLDLPVTLTAHLDSQHPGRVRHRFTLRKTMPLHPRCPDYVQVEYRAKSEIATPFVRAGAFIRSRLQASVATAGQPEYLMRALGGASTIRGMSSGELGLARALVSASAEWRVPIGGSGDPGQPSVFFGSLFADCASGYVLPGSEARGCGGAAGDEDAPLDAARGACVGAGILVGPIKFEFTLATTGEARRTMGIDY